MWISPFTDMTKYKKNTKIRQTNFVFFIFLSLWNTCKHWFLYIKSTLMTSVVLYSLTRATLMSPGKDETRFCGYIRSEFIHWVLWRTLMRTEYFLFVQHTTTILAKLSTWCAEHSDDISCSLLVNPSPGKDETRACGYLSINLSI